MSIRFSLALEPQNDVIINNPNPNTRKQMKVESALSLEIREEGASLEVLIAKIS